MATNVHKLPITAAEYLEGELRSERWRRNLYTQFETIVRLDSIGYAAPLASFYQSNPFPEDVQRPWYHLNRIED